jgi:hypothetical protein
MMDRRPEKAFDGSPELENLIIETLEIGMDRIRDGKAPFVPFLIAIVDGERGEAKCTHADYRQALAALKHEAQNLPPGTERYVVVYYGTIDYDNALIVEGFEGTDTRCYRFAHKFKRKGIFNKIREPRGVPLYLGRYKLMNPVSEP